MRDNIRAGIIIEGAAPRILLLGSASSQTEQKHAQKHVKRRMQKINVIFLLYRSVRRHILVTSKNFDDLRDNYSFMTYQNV